MKVQIGEIDDCDMINGGRDNIAHTIFFAGCDRDCIGCHNKSLQPIDSGYTMELHDVMDGIMNNNLASCFVATGGEPLLQKSQLIPLMICAWFSGKEVWLYTSYELDEIPDIVLLYCNVVKTGRYDESKRSYNDVLATSNQHYYRKGADGQWKLV